MRAVVQRVSKANVKVDNEIIGQINNGYAILLGISSEDTIEDLTYIGDKILKLRVFTDENDKMNLSIKDVNGELLIISQFTLYGDCRKGNRPSFIKAAKPDIAKNMYNDFLNYMKESGLKVESGKFQAHMDLEIHNDGPVTILYDSKKNF